MRPRRPLSGTQFSLRRGRYEADVASVGASLRTLPFDGRDLVVPFEADELRPSFRGLTLAPWPNRVVGGAYRLAGVDHQLPITEPDRGHALHGLAIWTDYEPREASSDRVVLAATIEPQAGYPWRVEVSTPFSLDDHGLVQTVTGRNVGSGNAPWGTGPHPYLVGGRGRVDDWELELPAADVLSVSGDLLVPTGLVAVDAEDPARFDFRRPRRLGNARIDHAFTTLAREEDGTVRVRLRADRTGVEITFDATCPWVQVHTADADDRIGLAVEPMTCAPDAFNSGTGLVLLEPGEAHTAGWRIAAID
ncbi:aldose 1-epimerase family protein [Aeromicrobium phoceense]|uniref:aldose 1-epimerase family protein n=1 Tax=Aeromicrobium phoceense TaxID=2754045 RepID=UPI0030B8483A